FIPILRAEIFEWVEDHNCKPIRPDHTRNKHVAGIPNDLYKGIDTEEGKRKKGFTYNRATYASFAEDIAGYGMWRINEKFSQLMQDTALDHDQYLTADTLQWCNNQWDILKLPPPQSNHFIRAFDVFDVPPYYKYLIQTARTHEQSEHTPRLRPAPKPYGGY